MGLLRIRTRTWPRYMAFCRREPFQCYAIRSGSQAGKAGPAQRGSAVSLPFPDGFFSAVVTDPPYDSMIDYADASDLFFVWMKRALSSTHPWFGLTSDPNDLQDKSEEIIVKKGGAGSGDHRTETFYDTMLTRAFAEANRAVNLMTAS